MSYVIRFIREWMRTPEGPGHIRLPSIIVAACRSPSTGSRSGYFAVGTWCATPYVRNALRDERPTVLARLLV